MNVDGNNEEGKKRKKKRGKHKLMAGIGKRVAFESRLGFRGGRSLKSIHNSFNQPKNIIKEIKVGLLQVKVG